MMFPKPKTYRSKKYLAFIRDHRCIVCGYDQTVAHHEPLGAGGKGIKAADTYTVPMCHKCHMDRHNIGFSYWGERNIDIKMQIIRLLTEYIHIKGM